MKMEEEQTKQRKIIRELDNRRFKEIKPSNEEEAEEVNEEQSDDSANESEFTTENSEGRTSRTSPVLQAAQQAQQQENIENIVADQPTAGASEEETRIYNLPKYESSLYDSDRAKYSSKEEDKMQLIRERPAIEDRGIEKERTFNVDRFSREAMASQAWLREPDRGERAEDAKRYKEERRERPEESHGPLRRRRI